MQDCQTKTIIKGIHSFNGIIAGTLAVFALLLLNRLMITLPLKLGKYFYLLPLILVFISTMTIPADLNESLNWQQVLRRLRFFSFSTIALSPFWIWWQYLPYSLYCSVNAILLLLSALLYIYNLANLATLAAADYNRKSRFAVVTGIIRLLVLYSMLSPAIAFLISMYWSGNNGKEIIIFLFRIRKIYSFIFGVPLCLTIFAIWYWKRQLIWSLINRSGSR